MKTHIPASAVAGRGGNATFIGDKEMAALEIPSSTAHWPPHVGDWVTLQISDASRFITISPMKITKIDKGGYCLTTPDGELIEKHAYWLVAANGSVVDGGRPWELENLRRYQHK